MTNKHEILADGYLLAVTEYKGKLLDFAIYFQPSEEVEDNEWHEVCPPLPFNRSEVEQLLALHIEELQYAEDAIETRNEAAIEFWREQHR